MPFFCVVDGMEIEINQRAVDDMKTHESMYPSYARYRGCKRLAIAGGATLFLWAGMFLIIYMGW